MANLKNFVIDFSSIQKEINTIADSEKSYLVTAPEEYLCVPEKYSEYGLCTLGQLIGFPANFIEKVNTTNKVLAREIIADRMKLYFKNDKSFVVITQKGDEWEMYEQTDKEKLYYDVTAAEIRKLTKDRESGFLDVKF